MGNRIHPTAVVGDGVVLGDANTIGPYAVLLGPCRLGDGNWVGPHATVGGPAERRDGPHGAAWEAGTTVAPASDGAGIEIGSFNVIREYVSVHQGSRRPTRIGDGGYFMTGSHVAHDCTIGDRVTLASAVQVAGGCHVWAWANLGLGSLAHQDTVIGPGAMVGMGSPVRGRVEPFTVTVGNPGRTAGFNEVGLRRLGCEAGMIEAIVAYLRGRGPLPEGAPAPLAGALRRWEETGGS